MPGQIQREEEVIQGQDLKKKMISKTKYLHHHLIKIIQKCKIKVMLHNQIKFITINHKLNNHFRADINHIYNIKIRITVLWEVG